MGGKASHCSPHREKLNKPHSSSQHPSATGPCSFLLPTASSLSCLHLTGATASPNPLLTLCKLIPALSDVTWLVPAGTKMKLFLRHVPGEVPSLPFFIPSCSSDFCCLSMNSSRMYQAKQTQAESRRGGKRFCTENIRFSKDTEKTEGTLRGSKVFLLIYLSSWILTSALSEL